VLLTVPVPPPGQKLRSCPDLVVEILSRDEGRRRDLEIKRRLYWRKGAREYWVVDSEQRTLLQLTRGPTEWVEQTLTDSDIVRSSLLPRWEGVALSSLFSPT
ncbi:MAG TPA: Uma2 family endonuclease, partial [Myxococcaceae bacterium]|nr:Uma2 family endonuclease [Myxococcaceae bacterium]